MSRSQQITWASTELQFTSADTVQLADGGVVRLVPVSDLVHSPEQLQRAQRKHGVHLDDLVPVEVTAGGVTRNHWKHTVKGAAA